MRVNSFQSELSTGAQLNLGSPKNFLSEADKTGAWTNFFCKNSVLLGKHSRLQQLFSLLLFTVAMKYPSITVGCIIFLYILYTAGSIWRAIGKALLVVSLVIPFLASQVCASRFAFLHLLIFFGGRRNKAEGSSPASFIRRISLYVAAFTAFQVIHLHLHIIPNLSVMGCTERRWHPVTYCCWCIVLRHHRTATSGIWPWVSLSKATTVPVV